MIIYVELYAEYEGLSHAVRVRDIHDGRTMSFDLEIDDHVLSGLSDAEKHKYISQCVADSVQWNWMV